MDGQNIMESPSNNSQERETGKGSKITSPVVGMGMGKGREMKIISSGAGMGTGRVEPLRGQHAPAI